MVSTIFAYTDSFTGTKTGTAFTGCADWFSASEHEPAQSGEVNQRNLPASATSIEWYRNRLTFADSRQG